MWWIVHDYCRIKSMLCHQSVYCRLLLSSTRRFLAVDRKCSKVSEQHYKRLLHVRIIDSTKLVRPWFCNQIYWGFTTVVKRQHALKNVSSETCNGYKIRINKNGITMHYRLIIENEFNNPSEDKIYR